jgi:hypothetical protein
MMNWTPQNLDVNTMERLLAKKSFDAMEVHTKMIRAMSPALFNGSNLLNNRSLDFLLKEIELIHLEIDFSEGDLLLNKNHLINQLKSNLITVLIKDYQLVGSPSEKAVDSAITILKTALLDEQLLMNMPFSIY